MARKSKRSPASAEEQSAGGRGAAAKKASKKASEPAPDAPNDAQSEAAGRNRVVAVGSVASDVIAIAETGLVERARFERLSTTFMMVEEGRKYTAESIATHLGGGGANAAVSAARQGWSSAMLAVIGQDADGDLALTRLSANGVDVNAIRRSAEAQTGMALMVTSDRPNAAMLVYRGANETLRLGDIKDETFAGARLVYIAPLSSGSADCFAALVEQGAWAGAMVAVSPGVRQLRSRAEAFLGALANVDLVSLNARELSVLALALIARGSAEATPAEVLRAAPRSPEEDERLTEAHVGEGSQRTPFREALAALHLLGPRLICVTDGDRGAYLSIAGGDDADEAGAPRVLFQPAAPVEAVRGTAGAGDAFGSTLACALAEGVAPEEAMRRAAVNAASVVGHVNTTDGLLMREALLEQVAALDE